MLNRREEVAKWLQKYLAAVKGRGNPAKTGSAKILDLVLIGDVEAAVEEAIENNYPHLACGLSVFKHSNRAAYKNQVYICF